MERDELGRFTGGTPKQKYTDEQMIKHCELYANHRATGKDKESFSFIGCNFKTIDSWLDSPTEDPALTMEKARLKDLLIDADAKGRILWETLLFNIGLGIPMEYPAPTAEDPENKVRVDPKGANATILIFMMKSKYRNTYGDFIKQESKTQVEATLSSPFTVVTPDGNVEDIRLGEA